MSDLSELPHPPLNWIIDTHYDGWFGILPKDVWEIIFKMVDQMQRREIVFPAVELVRRTTFTLTTQGVRRLEYGIEDYFHEHDRRFLFDTINTLRVWNRAPPNKYHNRFTTEEFEGQTVKQLRAECKANGLKQYSKKRKLELIKMLVKV